MSLQKKVERERLKKLKIAERLADASLLAEDGNALDGDEDEDGGEEEEVDYSWRDIFSVEVLKDLLSDLHPRKILASIKSIIPYTDEWHEATSAEVDLDDLRRIEYDLNFNRNLVTTVKIGRYKDALDTMMKGNKQRDFGMFNKLRNEMIAQGTFAPPPEGTFSRQKEKRGAQDNCLERAFHSTPELMNMQATAMKQLSKLASSAGANECMWRHRDGAGNTLKCHNVPVASNSKRGFPIRYCAFHHPSCIKNHGGAQIQIKIPNADALCMECYVAAHKSKPTAIAVSKVPGVYIASTRGRKAAKPGGSVGGSTVHSGNHDDDTATLDSRNSKATRSVATGKSHGDETSANRTADSSGKGTASREDTCKWRPSEEEMKTDRKLYICKCKPFRNPDTNRIYTFCAMHLKNCVKDHASGSGAIEEPNVYGLCNMHHISVIGSPPEPLQFPYPGMELRTDPRAAKRHPLAPRFEKQPDVVLEEVPLTMMDYKRDMSWLERRKANKLFDKRKLDLGPGCATKIQTVFRRYLQRHTLQKLRRVKLVRIRSRKVLVIQALARRYLGRKYFLALREEYTRVSKLLQRVSRGFLVRRFLRRYLAAATLQTLVHGYRLRKFQDTVMAIVLVIRMRKQRDVCARFLQRCLRGCMTRVKLRRYWAYRTSYINECAVRITQCVRIYIAKRKRRLLLEARREARRIKFIATRLASNLIILFRRKKARKLKALQHESARSIQRAYRAHHAMLVRRALKEYRFTLQDWCRPEVAEDFFNQLLHHGSGDLLNTKTGSVMTDEEVLAVARMSKGKTYRSRSRDTESASVSRRSARSKQVIPWEGTAITIPQAAFMRLLEEFYSINNLFVSESEISRLVALFKDPHDQIKMDEFKRYFDMHLEPCSLHGRIICTECSFPKECTNGECECTAFKLDEYGNGDICNRCQHPVTLHRKYPVQMKIKAEAKFKDVLDLYKAPDLEVPRVIVGETEIHVPSAAEIAERQTRSRLKSDSGRNRTPKVPASFNGRESVSPAKNDSLTTDLASCLIDGSVVEQEAYMKSYWKQNELELSIGKPREIEKKNDSLMVIETNPAPTDINSTAEEFWRNISKNQNKTVEEYTQGFGTNVSFPIVSHAELSYTWDSSKVYVMLLRRLVYLGERRQLDADDGDFLRLVVDNMQAFERHWRKFVIDIRTGTLNKHLLLSDAERTEYLSSCIPSPSIANALDAAFRALGFHMKVLGKDIMETAHATRKPDKDEKNSFNPRGSHIESVDYVRLRRRRRSFGSETLSSMVHESEMQGKETHTGWQSVSKNIMTCMDCSPALTSVDPLLATIQKVRGTTLDPLETRCRPDSMGGELAKLEPSKREFSNIASNVTQRIKRGKFGIRSLAAKLGEELKNAYSEKYTESILNGINGRPVTAQDKVNPSVRRGSETDILRPLEQSELQTIIYKLETAPKSSFNELLVKKDRFICPFPACGQHFISRDAALNHIKEHEQKHHLYSSTADADSMMRSYWPTDLPWVDPASKFNAPGVAPGSVVCPKCGVAFATNDMLRVHDRLKHIVKEVVRLPPHVLCIGKPSKTLPEECPPLPSCPVHESYEESCSYCKHETPKPSVRFYPSIRINFTLINGKGGSVVFSGEDSSKGVVIRSSTRWDGTTITEHSDSIENTDISRNESTSKISKRRRSGGLLEYKALVSGILLDSAGMPWLAVRRLLDAREARAEGVTLCKGFDFEYEVVVSQQSPERWFPVTTVVNKFYLAIETKYNFKAKVKSGELPSENIYFVRLE